MKKIEETKINCLLFNSNDKLEITRIAVDMRLALGHERILVAVRHARLDLDLQELLFGHIS